MYGVTKSRYKYKVIIQYNLINSFHSSSSTTTSQCYYKTLGVVANASNKDIRTAYIQMAKKYHPDVNTQSNSTAKFSSINEAYSILSDKMKKQKYDTQIGNYSNSNTQNKTSNKNWWDFNFYGNQQSSTNTNNSDDYYSEFEFSRDFYGDFSRYSSNNNNNNNSNNTKNRKRKRDIYEQFEHNKNNPYADYYYYYQQQIKNNNNNNNSDNNKQKYENIWSNFEFEFDIENDFESEFNNDAFWRFLRNTNKKHRTKQAKNDNNESNTNVNNNINENKKIKNKQKIKEKFKSNNNNCKDKPKEKKKEKEKHNINESENEKNETNENEAKTKKFKKNVIGVNDIEINLDLDFLEASLGCTKNINFNRNEICNNCGGTSYESSIECLQCIKCDGKGLIYGYGNDFVSHKCINCSGRGYIFKNCINCKGKSIININKSLTITIPSGIRCNDRVRVSKQGHQYSSYNYNNQTCIIKYGHIWINCNIKKHKHFIRINNDIHITMNIPYVLAVLGGSFVVPTIYGPNIIKILSGINTNDYEYLQGKGIYDSSTNKKGNQYVHFIVNIPQSNELNQQQKQLLNQYAKLEKPPFVIQTNKNLKHFKKYGQKVQTYNNNKKKSNDMKNDKQMDIHDIHNSDDDDDDDDDDDEDEDEGEDEGNLMNDDEYPMDTDVDIDDDLKDLL